MRVAGVLRRYAGRRRCVPALGADGHCPSERARHATEFRAGARAGLPGRPHLDPGPGRTHNAL